MLHQRVVTEAARAALAGVEGTGEIVGYRGIPTLASWGPLAIPGIKWALVAKIDTAEAFAPIYKLGRDLMIVGGLALLVVMIDRRLAVALAARPVARADRRRHALRRRRLRGQGGGPHARRDRPALRGVQRHGRRAARQERRLESKNRENEELLLNVLPAPIANRLRGGEQGIADGFAEVTVAFADLVGFTQMSADMPPDDVVALLNGLFTRFDQAARDSASRRSRRWATPTWRCAACPCRWRPCPRMVRMVIRMIHITASTPGA